MRVIIDGISGIILPIVNLLSVGVILKGVLAILAAADLLPDTGARYELVYGNGKLIENTYR